MATSSYPFEGQTTTETQYSKLVRELQDTGVCDTYLGTALNVTANATGMKVQVAAGQAIVRGHVFNSTASVDLTIEAAGSVTRTDLVVLHLDPAANVITLQIVKGDAVTGAEATLIKTDVDVYEIVLAAVSVPVGTVTIDMNKITDRRQFVRSRVGAWRTATRPSSPRVGQLGYNADRGQHEYHDGTAWSDIIPATLQPAGAITMYGGAAAPAGWLLCDGASKLRADYPALFAAIGTAYGSADSTHFNVPDMRSRLPYMTTLGTKAGAATHTHPLSNHGQAAFTMDSTTLYAALTGTGFKSTREKTLGGGFSGGGNDTQTGLALQGATDSGSTLPPVLGVNFIIRAA